jgi:hypothetical protein
MSGPRVRPNLVVPDFPADAESVSVVPDVIGDEVAELAVAVDHEVDRDAFVASHAGNVVLGGTGRVVPTGRGHRPAEVPLSGGDYLGGGLEDLAVDSAVG